MTERARLPKSYEVFRSNVTGRALLMGGGNVVNPYTGEIVGPRMVASWSAYEEMPEEVRELAELDPKARAGDWDARRRMARIYVESRVA